MNAALIVLVNVFSIVLVNLSYIQENWEFIAWALQNIASYIGKYVQSGPSEILPIKCCDKRLASPPLVRQLLNKMNDPHPLNVKYHMIYKQRPWLFMVMVFCWSISIHSESSESLKTMAIILVGCLRFRGWTLIV